jgi:hypothetical protein
MKRSTDRIRSVAMGVACTVVSLATASGIAFACEASHPAGSAAAAMSLLAAADETPPAAPAPHAPPRTPRPPRAYYYQYTVPTPAAPAAPAADMAPSRILPRGWFGFGLQCDACSASRSTGDSVAVWTFGSRPRVYLVSDDSPAAHAGIMRGDIITKIDNVAIDSEDGGKMFGMIRPGQTVRWTVERDGQTKTLVGVAEERPERRARLKAYEDLRAALGRLNYTTDLQTMRVEIERLSQRINQMNIENFTIPPMPQRPIAARQLRYAGVVGGAAEVEVRGSTPVIVSQSDDKNETVINIGESVVVIRIPEAAREKKKDR